MEYQKIDETSFKSIETTTKETVYNLDDLNARKEGYLKNIDNCNEAIKEIDDLIKQWEGLGTITKADYQLSIDNKVKEDIIPETE